MAKPNNSPIVITGKNANNGPVVSTPNRLLIKPSCMISVVNPKVAANDNTNPSTAFKGIIIDLNTTINNMKANNIITPANNGIASLSFSDISILITL